MIIRDRRAGKWPKQTIHFAVIVALLLQRQLDIADHLIGRQIVVSVDRNVIWIIRVTRIVPPGRIPESGIPIVPASAHQDDSAVVITPPEFIVPHRSVIPECPIIFTLPVLASLNSSVLLKLHSRDSRIRLVWQV